MPQRIAAAVVTAVLLGGSAATAQHGAPAGEWPAYGGDHGSTKYSPLGQIDRGNVGRLREVWRWESPDNPIVTEHRTTLPALPAAFKSTPVLADGVLYVKNVAVAGGGRRRRDRRDPVGVRPRELGGRAARQHRLQRARRGLLVGRAGRAGLPAHRRRLPVGARRADGAARRRLRRRRRRRRHPGPAPTHPAARLPVDVGADSRRRRRRHRLGRLRRPPLPARRAGRRARLRRAHGGGAVGVPHHPPARRARERDVGERILGILGRDERLGHADRRPRARLRLPAAGHPDQRLLRRPPPRRQPLRREHRVPRRGHRRARLALPVRPPRRLGLRRRRRPRCSWTSKSTVGRSGPSRW